MSGEGDTASVSFFDERTPLIGAGAVDPAALAHDDDVSQAAHEFKADGLEHRGREGHASLGASILNLSNTILGAGLLSISYVLRLNGLLFGVFLLIFAGAAAAFGLHLLVVCAERVTPTADSFFAVARHTYPLARWLIDLAVALKCFGVACSYLIVAGELLPTAVLGIRGSEPGSLLEDRRFWIGLSMAVAVPLSLLSNINSLRFASFLAVGTVAYTVVMVFVYYFYRDSDGDSGSNGGVGLAALSSSMPGAVGVPPSAAEFAQVNAGPTGEIRWWEWDLDIFSALPIVVFAYTCAQNIFSIRQELSNPTRPRTHKVGAHVQGHEGGPGV